LDSARILKNQSLSSVDVIFAENQNMCYDFAHSPDRACALRDPGWQGEEVGNALETFGAEHEMRTGFF
jgi:hypothetical protein